MWLGHADLCRGSMDMCQLYQSLWRASVRLSIFEPDIARRNVLWYSMANQNQSRKFMLQSIVLNIMFLSLTRSSHKDWRLKNCGVFGLFLFKKLRNITAPDFFCFCWKGPLERVHWLFQWNSIRSDTLIKGCVKRNTKIPFKHKLHVTL